MTMMSGGEALVQSLVREGVDVVFGIPGIHMSGIIAALRDHPGIRMITTRHEQAAAHMADGYARVSGKPGVVLVVPGAGVYNAASGLSTAYARSSPVLAIAGQIPRGQIGSGLGTYHEVLGQADIVGAVTKWRDSANTPQEIPPAVTEAFRQMRSGRPYPVLIEIPPEAGVERDEVTLLDPAPVPRIVPSHEQLREAARLIAESRLPVIYAGGGVARSDAEAALVRLAEATKIPVVTSCGGKGTIPDRHPLAYGSCFAHHGEFDQMNQLFEVMEAADLVIGIGTRFSLGNPAGEAATLININIEESELTRVQANTHPLHGDAKATIEALLPLLEAAGAGNRPSPVEAVVAARRLIAYRDIHLKEPHYPILETMQRSVPEDTHIVWDVTQFGYYARTHYQVHEPKTFIDSGYSFNLGFGFPTALGAKVAHPDRPVISVNGDGGFLFNAVELATAVRYGINVTSIVFRDDAYGNVARDLEEFFDGDYETGLHNPDFVAFTESFGAVGMRADDPQDLKDLLPRALESEAPVVIDVPVGDLQLPRAEFMAVLPKLPWVRPQEGLIGS
ncbi:MAG: thiamine pyrophosphate-binding protein [Chloroflexota bacterium]|nr:thiamine pyrophosphate-binding protein [Chloroflexota bacterium]MDE2919361.1 thiamine pyrophosphate-binding protein [Chloroflexota bacterium]